MLKELHFIIAVNSYQTMREIARVRSIQYASPLSTPQSELSKEDAKPMHSSRLFNNDHITVKTTSLLHLRLPHFFLFYKYTTHMSSCAPLCCNHKFLRPSVNLTRSHTWSYRQFSMSIILYPSSLIHQNY